MPNLTETAQWEAGIYQLETTDPVVGGPDGVDNLPHKALANRTQYLKQQVETVGGNLAAHEVASNPHPQYLPSNLLTAKGDLLSRSDTAPLVVPVGANGAVLLGDSSQATGLTWQVLPFQCGRLIYVSPTQIQLTPFAGNRIPLRVGALWTLYTIPAAGLTAGTTNVRVNGVDGQNLAASTTYLVCLTDVGGTKVLEYIPLATGHAPDSDMGVEIIAGSPTRTLVGMVCTDATAQFSSSLVLSWFNRAPQGMTSTLASSLSTLSTTPVEVSTALRAGFLVWPNSVVLASANLDVRQYPDPESGAFGIGFDGTTMELSGRVTLQSNLNRWTDSLTSTVVRTGLVEGYHYATVLAFVINVGTSPTPYLFGADFGASDPASLSVLVR